MKHPDRPFAIVIWDDAKVINDETKIEDIASSPTTRFHTAGWIVKSNDKGIWIAAEWAPEDHNWRTITSVPRGMVVDEQVLGLVIRKPRKKKEEINGQLGNQRERDGSAPQPGLREGREPDVP